MLARCHADGSLADERGRVEIRYKPNDGRAYSASARNLKPAGDALLPDEHCGPAERPAQKKGGARKKGGKKSGPTVAPPTRPEDGEVLVYCDGACSGNPGPAGLGVIMLWDGGKRGKQLSEFLGRGTNNIAELTAILRAVEGVPDPSLPLRIFTDSTYSIGVLTKGWKAKKNKALIAEIKDAIADHGKVKLFYVKGHADIPLNELADQLAVQAVETRDSAGWTEHRGR